MSRFERWTLGEQGRAKRDGPTRVEIDTKETRAPNAGACVGATLTLLHGTASRQLFYVDATGGTLGRGEEADFRLTNSTVSRLHARLSLRDGDLWLEDLGSTNGTFVEAEAVIGERRLPTSCRLRLGLHTVMQLVAVDDSGADAYQRLQRAMFIDTLTGAGNRRFLNRRLEEELSYGIRHNEEVGVLLLDLDHFKRVNDTWGHTVGDRVLAEVSRIIEDAVRMEDSLYRYGGEEFCVLVRGVDRGGLERMAERIRSAVERFELGVGDDVIRCTLSIGVACVMPEEADDPITLTETMGNGDDAGRHRVIMLADQALYQAKEAGRNMVVLHTTSS